MLKVKTQYRVLNKNGSYLESYYRHSTVLVDIDLDTWKSLYTTNQLDYQRHILVALMLDDEKIKKILDEDESIHIYHHEVIAINKGYYCHHKDVKHFNKWQKIN